MNSSTNIITARSVILGTFFAALFAWFTVYAENRNGISLVANQIAGMPYVLLFASVLLINPLCCILPRVRVFSIAEVLVVFIMGAVSAGIPTYNMASHVLPMIHGMHLLAWNNKQSQWDLHIEPFVNDAYTLAVPGTREAAQHYRESYYAHKKESTLLARAKSVIATREDVIDAESDLAQARSETVDLTHQADRVDRAAKALVFAQKARRQAETYWAPHATEYDPQEVLMNRPGLVEKALAVRDQRHRELNKLKETAYARIDTFRGGLPKEMRAIPGFIKTPDEDLASWFDRISRLRHGMQALAALQAAREVVSAEEKRDRLFSVESRRAIAAHLGDAAEALVPICNLSKFEALVEGQTKAFQDVSDRLRETGNRLRDLQQERRSASVEAFEPIDHEVSDLLSKKMDLTIKLDASKISMERAGARLEMSKRVASAFTRIREWETKASGDGPLPISELRGMLEITTAQLVTCDATLERFLIGDIEWSIWGRPLMRWGWLIGLSYTILMALNLLIFRQWARHEKLTYPLAELPKLLAGHEQDGEAALSGNGKVPSLYRSGLFWAGFAVPTVVIGWNLLCHIKVIPGLNPISFSHRWDPYIEGSFLEGLIPMGRFDIFFVLIGLTFLIPANISFSMWFFHVLYLLQLLVLVWLGYGVNAHSFPSNWISALNFRYAEGGGSLIVFSSVVLYKCRGYILCCIWPESVRDFERDERIELRAASFLFISCSLALILTLWLDMGAGLLFTGLFYIMAILTTIGMIRCVAEGGVLGFQSFLGPFHIVRAFFAGAQGWLSTSLCVPLMMVQAVLFLDLKTFIAPTMANCIKIRDDLRLSRFRFHVSILAAIVVSSMVAIAVHLMLAYDNGVDAMNNWFYTGMPYYVYHTIQQVSTLGVADTGEGMGWLIFGALMMAGLLYGRRFVFWFPHPIGLVMLCNPIMHTHYSSILLGWVIKSLVTKYGSKETFLTVRRFFIGMIMGEILIVAFATLLSYLLDIRMGISLDRN